MEILSIAIGIIGIIVAVAVLLKSYRKKVKSKQE